MNTNMRREAIKQDLLQANTPISATTLAKKYKVSRQVIVGDIALLRAMQLAVLATPRGYILERKENANTYTIASIHTSKDTKEELEIIVDLGGKIEDVFIEHPIYGEIRGNLHIHSRYDIEQYLNLCKDKNAKNLSELSEGIHFHTICVPNEEIYHKIIEALNKKGYIYNEE